MAFLRASKAKQKKVHAFCAIRVLSTFQALRLRLDSCPSQGFIEGPLDQNWEGFCVNYALHYLLTEVWNWNTGTSRANFVAHLPLFSIHGCLWFMRPRIAHGVTPQRSDSTVETI